MSTPTNANLDAPLALSAVEPKPYEFKQTHASVNQYLKKVSLIHHMAARNWADVFVRYQALPADLRAKSTMLTAELGGTKDITQTMWQPFLRTLGQQVKEADRELGKGKWNEAIFAAEAVEEIVGPVRGIIKEIDTALKELEATASARPTREKEEMIEPRPERRVPPRQLQGNRGRGNADDDEEDEEEDDEDESGFPIPAQQRQNSPPRRDQTARRGGGESGCSRGGRARTPAGRRSDRDDGETGRRSPPSRRRGR